MDQKTKLNVRLELIWWLFTAIVLVAILFPIIREITPYPFLWANCLFIIAFITLTRYVFLLQHTFLAKRQILKAIIVLTITPVIFYLISEVNYFQTYLDEIGIDHLLENMSLSKKQNMVSYIRSEMLFFGVGSVIAAIIFPFRLMLSIWRNRNLGTA